MKTTNKDSANEVFSSEIETPCTRTLDEVMLEIQEIINNTLWVETRLQQLKSKGFLIEDCWVKNGSIGTIWYMKQKQVYRIQVTTSELHGGYHKANCVVIPFNDLSVQISELVELKNSKTIKRPRKKIQKSGI
jgi:hypothetical protein